jgi:hypothetical protein
MTEGIRTSAQRGCCREKLRFRDLWKYCCGGGNIEACRGNNKQTILVVIAASLESLQTALAERANRVSLASWGIDTSPSSTIELPITHLPLIADRIHSAAHSIKNAWIPATLEQRSPLSLRITRPFKKRCLVSLRPLSIIPLRQH